MHCAVEDGLKGPNVTRVYLTPTIVPPGGQVTIHVEDYDGNEGPADAQVGFSRVELHREVFGFSACINAIASKNFQLNLIVPEIIKNGPHVLTDLRLIPSAPDDGVIPSIGKHVNLLTGRDILENIVIYFGEKPSISAVDEIQDLRAKRIERIEKRIEVGTAPASGRLRVAYLYNGLLVRAPQHCEGYSILPYGEGLAPTSIFSALNQFSAEVFRVTFPLQQQQVNQYSSQQPLAAILFHNVGATSADTAMKGMRSRADEISLALAFERGQAPEPFGCIVENGDDLEMWLLHRPYRGNWLQGFGHTDQGAEVERLTSAMKNSPFSRLLIELYVQAISENDSMFMVFRFWAILELLAKRALPDSSHHIFDAHGARIYLDNGQPVTTSRAEAKVYKYLFDQGIGGSYCTFDTPDGRYTIVIEGVNVAPPLDGRGIRITYWEYIQAIYEIRNGIAHAGRFNPQDDAAIPARTALASQLLALNRDSVVRQIRDTAKLAVLRELHQLSQLAG